MDDYQKIRSGTPGYFEQKRCLLRVSGAEAVRFLNGLVTNDVSALEDRGQLLAALPNAQGRLIAVVRIARAGDEFFVETAEETHEKVLKNLARFVPAGDFAVDDLSENFRYFATFGRDFLPATQARIEFATAVGADYFVYKEDVSDFVAELKNIDAAAIGQALFETLRIESGVPKYGVDMDETTIVPELGIEDMISYKKGCYIGQEIIARIHFRGHVAKRLTGLIVKSSELARDAVSAESSADLRTSDGKNAGRITSLTYSPALKQIIALAYVRYDYLAEGTELLFRDQICIVRNLPFI